MEANSSSDPLEDPVVRRVSYSCLNLMAGTVPKARMGGLQRQIRDAAGEYPWESITDAIVEGAPEPQTVVQQGLRAQRDWIQRGGRETPGPSLKARGKGALAALLARLIFLLLYTIIVGILLLAIEHMWPGYSLSALLQWLYEAFPKLESLR